MQIIEKTFERYGRRRKMNKGLKTCNQCGTNGEKLLQCSGCQNQKRDEKRLYNLMSTSGSFDEGLEMGWPTVEQNRFYVVCDSNRKEVHPFLQTVENKICASNKEAFRIHLNTWKSLLFFIMSVPIELKQAVINCAPPLGLKVCDGVPIMFSFGVREDFPIGGNNVWTIENRPN